MSVDRGDRRLREIGEPAQRLLRSAREAPHLERLRDVTERREIGSRTEGSVPRARDDDASHFVVLLEIAQDAIEVVEDLRTQGVQAIFAIDRHSGHVVRRILRYEQRFVRRRDASGLMGVKAVPRLYTQLSPRDHVGEDLGGFRARVVFKRREDDVDAQIVRGRERAFWERGTEAHRLVDLRGARDVLLDELRGLVDHRGQDANRIEALAHLRRELRPAFLVRIISRARLAPEFLRHDEQLHRDRHRALGVLHQVLQHIDADLIRQLERAQRKSGLESHGGIDRLDRDSFEVVNPRGFFEEGTEDARRDEPGDVLLHDDDRLAKGPRKVDRRLEGRVVRRLGADHLDELHEHRWIEEMHPDDFVRPLRHNGHVRDRQRGRVRRQDRLRRRRFVEFTEHFLLQVDVFKDRLNREIRIVQSHTQIERRMNAVERLVHLLLADLILLDEFSERPSDPIHAAVDVFLLDIPHADVVAVQSCEFRDAVAHLPRADDRDFHSVGILLAWMDPPRIKMWWAFYPKVYLGLAWFLDNSWPSCCPKWRSSPRRLARSSYRSWWCPRFSSAGDTTRGVRSSARSCGPRSWESCSSLP